MSMSVGPRKSGVSAEINVTPFADIMIVLLIIFMIATTAIDKDDRLRLPPAAHGRETEKAPLVVKVTREGSLLLGGVHMLDGALLETALKQQLASGAARQVHVQADDGLAYDRVAPALAFVRAAGAEQIVLRTQPGMRTTRNP